MTWLLLDPGGSLIASGSWWGVIEQGAEIGVIELRESRRDGSMACPRLRAGFAMVPAPMIPEAKECVCYA